MLLDPTGAGRSHCRLLLLKLGDDIRAWPLRIVRALQIAILIAVSVLWRKLFLFFKAYPWALAPAFDETRTDEERRDALHKVFGANWCCLDMGLGRPLRKGFPRSIDAFWGTPLRTYLTVLFTRLVMTSTQVEL